MKPFLIFLAWLALFHYVPFWLILRVTFFITLACVLAILVFMVLMDFFVGDE